MIRRIIVAALLLAAFAVSAGAETADQPSGGRPRLKAEAIVTGEIVRIGDLVDHAGIVASVPIFRAPDLGYTGTVSADAVLDAVRRHALIGVDTAGINDIVVTRASRTIPAKDVETLVAQTLSSRFDLGPSKDIVVNFAHDMHSIHVEPSARGEPRVTHIDFDSHSGRFDATLEFPIGAGKRSAVRLAGRATPTVQVVILTRPVDRGTIIKEADVIMERRPRAEVGRDIVSKHEDAVGYAARAGLQPGRPLRTADLMKPDLVQRNESVTLVYEVPGIVLTIRGKAADGGAEGDVISVLNEQSKRMVQGVIIGPGRVAVASGSPRLAANNIGRSGTTNPR